MKRSTRYLVALGLIGLLAGLAPVLANTTATKLAGPDETFVTKAAAGGLAEVELGKLAAQKASDPDVKAFGQRMVDDHSKANDKLKEIATTKGVTVPTQLKGEAKSLYDKLSKASGAAFDKMYMHDMLMDHQKDVKEFEKESSSAKDSDVKQFAADTLPTLKEHLKLAQTTASKVGATSHASAASNKAKKY
jgi:putative membrane protein